MTREHAPKPKSPQSREDRLKAALKANMAKRKAQAKARSGSDTSQPAAARDKDNKA